MSVIDIQRRLLNGEQYDPSEKELLYYKGQTERLPYYIDEDVEPVIIIENSISQDSVRCSGTRTVILEGECHHCGSNRIKKTVKEPPGEQFVVCPVCNRDNISTRHDFNYSIK